MDEASNVLRADDSTCKSLVSPDTSFHLYGNTEIQVSEGGEADLHKYLCDCQKNPGHKKFIPVKLFSMQHLPNSHKDHDLYELIKSTADLTVRVEVKMTSPHRPEFYPGTNVPYPFYNMRDKTTLRLGSGEIAVWEFRNGSGFDSAGDNFDLNGENYFSYFKKSTKTCPCIKCQQSDKPNNVWWEIFVRTAAHVVFDEIEASHTSCGLFYDEDDSPVVSLDKFSVCNISIDKDRCELKYVTCESLGAKLYGMSVQRFNFGVKVLKNCVNKQDTNWSFIVSHPHGCYKQISFGRLTGLYKVSDYNDQYNLAKMTYKTSTCPGSSGAPVYCLGSSHGHVHSGALDSGINYSGVDLYIK